MGASAESKQCGFRGFGLTSGGWRSRNATCCTNLCQAESSALPNNFVLISSTISIEIPTGNLSQQIHVQPDRTGLPNLFSTLYYTGDYNTVSMTDACTASLVNIQISPFQLSGICHGFPLVFA
jgi:hypothetical protein